MPFRFYWSVFQLQTREGRLYGTFLFWPVEKIQPEDVLEVHEYYSHPYRVGVVTRRHNYLISAYSLHLAGVTQWLEANGLHRFPGCINKARVFVGATLWRLEMWLKRKRPH